LEQLVEYLENLRFSREDIEFLRSKNTFSEAFLSYLADFRFRCDVWSMREGTPIFPGEPIVVVRGPALQAQLVETMLLLTINHQSLIATKANRLVRAADGRAIFEFGSRRAQGYDAAVLGARAACIGGCVATACVMADQCFGFPSVGTMAHSWVQMFRSEYDAFKAYALAYPDNCTLLVDTYNALRSGVPNAVQVFDEVLLPLGKRPKGIRIDSGDIAYLSKKARGMLDAAGYPDVKIIASNSLDEYIIRELLLQGAPVDMFGVGENLITSRTDPIFGGVYKLVAVREGERYVSRMKISESPEKITTPGFKTVYRFFDRESGKAEADYICFFDEIIDDCRPITIFDPQARWKSKTLTDFEAYPLLTPVFEKGRRVYNLPSLPEIQRFAQEQLSHIWPEVKRFEYPHNYYVDLSEKLWTEKMAEISRIAGQH
jgi:nicotinate phosphoribosyltransferase